MKKLLLSLVISLVSYGGSWANEARREIPVGTTFSIKTDFWVYEIKGLFSSVKDSRYTMNSDRGSGIGGNRFKYRATFPAGTRFELASLVKKNKQKWIYIVKARGGDDSQIGESTISIFPLSMLEEPWGRRVKFVAQPTQKIRLDPDLFTDFVYPDE